MAAVPGQDRTLATLPAPGLATSLKLFLLRVAPVVLAIAVEPWAAAADAIGLLGGKLRRGASEHALGLSGDTAETSRRMLTAATWLLGVCVFIIIVLKVTDQNARTWADEVAWAAAGFMALSIVVSRGRGRDAERVWRRSLADWLFLIGSAGVLVSMIFLLLLL